MQTDFDNNLQSYFTDMEHLRGAFKKYVSAITLSKRLFVIHGVGGAGKSSLLRMFRIHCRSEKIHVALASGDDAKSVFDIIMHWMNDLKTDGVKFSSLSKTMETYHAIQAKVNDQAIKTQNASRQIADIASKTASKTAETAGGALMGAAIGSIFPGVGTAIGGALGGVLGGMGAEALADWLRGFLTKPDIDLLLDPSQKLTSDFLDDIAKAAEKQRIVLMLDTFEQMTALDDWARDVAQRIHPNVLIVIAGRKLPDWNRAWQGWMINAQVEELKPMTEDIMRELIRRYYATMRGGEPDPEQVETIIRFARGLPMVITSAVQLWVKYGVEDFQSVKAEIVANLVDRLMEGVPSNLIPALEAAAVVRWFDQPILRAVTKQEDVRDVYNELRRFPFVRSRSEGLALHDSVREMMDENLRVQDSERHSELHKRAAVYFEKRLEKTMGEEAERLALERLYHSIRIDEKAGIKLFQEMAETISLHRLVNRLRAILNDVNTYQIDLEENRLWRDYYHARLMHLVGRLDDAMPIYENICNISHASPRLQSYALSDLGEILSRYEFTNEPNGIERAIDVLERSTMVAPVDNKTAISWLSLAWVYRCFGKWDDVFRNLSKATQYYKESSDSYNTMQCLDQKIGVSALCGEWLETINNKREAISIIDSLKDTNYAKAKILGRWSLEIWIGQWAVAESEFRKSIATAENVEDSNLLTEASKRLGWVLGLQNRNEEAQVWFSKSLEIESKTLWSTATTIGFQGLSLINKDPREAQLYLQKSLDMKIKANILMGVPELLNGLGYISEIDKDFIAAENHYRQSLEYRELGRIYFACNALIGLARMKFAQNDSEALLSLLADADGLAQKHEYNDCLASMRLAQGHLAWRNNHQDRALSFYQHAIIYALRYNRFLLDELLSGRPQGTPLRPIIPYCLERGEERKKTLIALRDWWKTGVNDVGSPRPDTISPIPEGIPLLDAEKLARQREPGDGSMQRSMLEQLEAALK
jgi:tetratricopeptide (TPR) repeat protein/uncharacterized membrane protein